MMENKEESDEIEKLKQVKKAIDELEGVAIPYNIISHCINPFAEWLEEVLEVQNG